MNIVFFGTSRFAAIILRFLLQNQINIVAVVTRTDKPQGRSLKISSPPVKEMVAELFPSLPILQPVKASTPKFIEQIKAYKPDLFIVAAYGEIMKTILLDVPPLGAINIHGSLLPKYRGAAPIQRSLMNGDLETGITIMKMVLEMDAGDILEMVKVPVSTSINFGQLEEKLAESSCPALMKVIEQIKNRTVKAVPQNHSQATYAAKISSQETEIQWNRSADQIHNLIRALSPQPGAWCFVEINGERKRLKIRQSQIVPPNYQNDKEIIIPCGMGKLQLLEVQLEGKKNLPAAEFLRGFQGMFKII